ncbi:hypothetical protein HFP89_03125 [Wenzhouxiangella sp. XN79A]|uniref:hypothetical protein n=1 Tax=Wenzhouxiangella sp. XN79A TaxID=2724193 RepID=UPI00144AC57F|nr:hypothetical protein [Wenzhouxiangella sp. XN79A]NKI34157.1 hypothetical protein [Wenzhouxiangella sp. XN79A]
MQFKNHNGIFDARGSPMLHHASSLVARSGLALFILMLAGHAVAQASANLVVNGSFENRTSPPPPTSGFSSGVPDDWVDLLGGNTYLVHESHPTVPGNAAIDGEIIVGGGAISCSARSSPRPGPVRSK